MKRRPDRARALEAYRRHAPTYDRTSWMTRRLRRRAISLLALDPGDTVLDVGSGTGLSLPMLRDAVGPQGRVVGIELSPEMATKAHDRIVRAGWNNVSIITAPAEQAEIDGPADAALFFLTHDLMRDPDALDNVLAGVRSDGRVVAFGAKLPPPWAFPLIPLVWLVGRPYVTTYEGARKPWSHLERRVRDLRVRPALVGCVYFAWGAATQAH